MKRILSGLFGGAPGPEHDPLPDLQAESTGIDPVDVARNIDHAAANLTEISKTALIRAGAAINLLGPPADRESLPVPSRMGGEDRKLYIPGSKTPDFTRHMFGTHGDNRIRGVIRARKAEMGKMNKQIRKPVPRRATT